MHLRAVSLVFAASALDELVDLVATYHTCALWKSGQATCWGRNADGRLGMGDSSNRQRNLDIPVKVDGTIVMIAAGGYHGCAVLDGGCVKCWGENDHGQLGLGHEAQLGDAAGEMESLTCVPLGEPATKIFAGDHHSCAILSSGRVKCWGKNNVGQLGARRTSNIGDDPGEMESLDFVDLGERKVLELSMGKDHTCALMENLQAKCWGNGADGQLGRGSFNSHGGSPGDMGDNLPDIHPELGTVKQVECGYHHTCLVMTDRKLYCFGQNSQGELGIGDRDDRSEPQLINVDPVDMAALGYQHTCVAGSSVMCWGRGDQRELGRRSTSDSTVPIAVSWFSGVQVLKLTSRGQHTCAITSTSIVCWGSNDYGPEE